MSHSTSTGSTSLTKFTQADATKAELLWTLKVVSSHYSYNSCAGNGELFSAMFPDSEVAKNYKCSARKTSYLVSFGIAPYYKSMLERKVKALFFLKNGLTKGLICPYFFFPKVSANPGFL